MKSIIIRLLTLDDVDEWLEQCEILDSESGENNVYFGPYSREEPFSKIKIRKKTIKLWSQKITVPSWRRAWGIFDENQIIGSAQIAAGDLPTSLHRVDFGIGIMKEYRNFGLGTKLINVIIDWCKEQPSISWIDLGVFSGNDGAKMVFEKNVSTFKIYPELLRRLKSSRELEVKFKVYAYKMNDLMIQVIRKRMREAIGNTTQQAAAIFYDENYLQTLVEKILFFLLHSAEISVYNTMTPKTKNNLIAVSHGPHSIFAEYLTVKDVGKLKRVCKWEIPDTKNTA